MVSASFNAWRDLFFCVMKYLPKWMRIFMLILPLVFTWKFTELFGQWKVSMDPLMFERISFSDIDHSKIGGCCMVSVYGLFRMPVVAEN